MIYTKNNFEKQMQSLPSKGFEFKSEIQGYNWKQQIDNRINQITIGYKAYPGSFYLQTPFASIVFLKLKIS